MSERVPGRERQPVGHSLGQGRLQTVVVGTGIIRHIVDKPKVWELFGVRTHAGARCVGKALIDVGITSQV